MTCARVCSFLLGLLGLVLLAAPAHAQTAPDGISDQRFSSPETQRLGSEITAQNREYDANERRMEELGYGAEHDRLEDRNEQIEETYTQDVEALIRARVDAIEGAPVKGSPEERRKTLEAKQEAIEQLQSYASGELSVSSDYYPSFSSSYYPDYSSQIEAARAKEAAAEAAPEQPEEKAGAEQGSGGSTGAPRNGDQPEPKPDEAAPEEPAPETGSGSGTGAGLPDINIVPILVFATLAIGGLYALSRSAGMSVGQFFSPAMASVRKPKPKPKKPAPKPSKPKPEPEPEPKPEPEKKPKTKPAPNLADESDEHKKRPTPEPEPEPEKPRPEPKTPGREDLTAKELEELFNRSSGEGEPGKGEGEDDDENPPD